MAETEEIRNAVEHALMNDEITIACYESLLEAIRNNSFTLIHVEKEMVSILIPNGSNFSNI